MSNLNEDIARLGQEIHAKVRPALTAFISEIGCEDDNEIHNRMSIEFRDFMKGLVTMEHVEQKLQNGDLRPGERRAFVDRFRADMIGILDHTYQARFVTLFDKEPVEKLEALQGFRLALVDAIGDIERFKWDRLAEKPGHGDRVSAQSNPRGRYG